MGVWPSREVEIMSREDFLQEQRRVLSWSAETLARTDQNIDSENSFLVDYDAVHITAKVDQMIERLRAGKNVESDMFLVMELSRELKNKMSTEYMRAYEDLRHLGYYVDQFAEKQRKLHRQILDLDPTDSKKLHRLRIKVYENVKTCDRVLKHYKHLRNDFVQKVRKIDYECTVLCMTKIKAPSRGRRVYPS